MKDGIAKIQAHKRRFTVHKGKHRRESSFGSTTFTDGDSDSEDETEFCGSGEWAAQGVSGVAWSVVRTKSEGGGGGASVRLCFRFCVSYLSALLYGCSCSPSPLVLLVEELLW